jgi:SAM-dependent methyltransferase
MLKITNNNIKDINSWKLNLKPFKAIDDFSELKAELRWNNKEHIIEYNKNLHRRKKIAPVKNSSEYYKAINLPIDKGTWDYLRIRKPYYIMPLGWENIARNGGNIIDMGCGDGDVIQNLIDYVIHFWKVKKIKPKKIKIIGIDLNQSRVNNAKKFVRSKSSYIEVKFLVEDLTRKKFNLFENKFFDYCICAAFMEMLDDKQFENLLNNIKKLVRKGLYIQNLVDNFPGGFPRQNLSLNLMKIGFKIKKKFKIFSQPFSRNKLIKPIISAILVHENIYAET